MYLAGWAASAGALATLILIIRLLRFGERRAAPPGGVRRPDPDTGLDYGLLRSVSLIGDLAFARDVRDRLRHNGVRATLATGHDGMVRVLVFANEYDRARLLLAQ
jgi:hypothetical protein